MAILLWRPRGLVCEDYMEYVYQPDAERWEASEAGQYDRKSGLGPRGMKLISSQVVRVLVGSRAAAQREDMNSIMPKANFAVESDLFGNICDNNAGMRATDLTIR